MNKPLVFVALLSLAYTGCDSLPLPKRHYSAKVKQLAGEYRIETAVVQKILVEYQEAQTPKEGVLGAGDYFDEMSQLKDPDKLQRQPTEPPQETIKRLSEKYKVPKGILQRIIWDAQ